MSRRPTRRAVRDQERRRRDAVDLGKNYVPQTSSKFKPPTPAEVERTLMLKTLADVAQRQFSKDTDEQDRLRSAGDTIELLIDLRAGKIRFGDLDNEEDQVVARNEVLRRVGEAPDPWTLYATVRQVVAEIIMRRQIRLDLARFVRALKTVFRTALVTEVQGQAWVVNELLDLHDHQDEPHARAGADIVDVAPKTFGAQVRQAQFKLEGAPGMLDEARMILAQDIMARGNRYRLSPAEYDAMVGPANRKGGRSVDSPFGLEPK